MAVHFFVVAVEGGGIAIAYPKASSGIEALAEHEPTGFLKAMLGVLLAFGGNVTFFTYLRPLLEGVT